MLGFMLGMLAAIAVYSEAISENSRKGRRVLSEESFNDADSTERAPLIRSSTIDIIRNQYQNEDNLSPDRPNNGTNHFISRISHYVPFNGENPNSNTTNPSQK